MLIKKEEVKNMRDEKGITMSTLIITVIILTLLAGIIVTTGQSGKELVRETENDIKAVELSNIQNAVLEDYIKYKKTNNDDGIVGNELSYSDARKKIHSVSKDIELKARQSTNNIEKYYLLEPEDVDKLGIKGVEDTYVVNYSTGEVANVSSKKDNKGHPLYIYAK